MQAVDLTGKQFGRLTVMERSGRDQYRYATWLCVCECGHDTIARGQHLQRGDTKSCGCLLTEARRSKTNKHTTHGMYDTPTWRSWMSMRSRCTYKKNIDYARYGGRGISIDERWDPNQGGSFLNFLADMGERPDNHTLDRIDSNGHYEPANCRWSTPKEQANNRGHRPSMEEWLALRPWITVWWLQKAIDYLVTK